MNNKGSFTLRASTGLTAPASDVPAATFSTETVSIGRSVCNAIEKPYDTDRFRVTLEEGTAYRVALKAVTYGLLLRR